jgi:hypothetical protein
MIVSGSAEDIRAMEAHRAMLDKQITAAKEAAKREKIAMARAARKAEAETHYARMLDEIGRPLAGLNEAQHGIVYAVAYDQGHSSGYDEVEMYYGEFAEMARKLLAAN